MADVVNLTEEDREALRNKYREERDKRLRPDGPDQYLEPTGSFAYLEEDPYTSPVERAPLTDHVKLLFIGGGFAGVCIGARLREAGFDDFRIIEGAGDFGGVWYWNRYPGAMCDTAAMVYLPLLEETGHMPSQKYVQAPEIWNHAKRIAGKYDLYERAVFSTHVRTLTWDESTSVWIIETDRGDRFTAQYVATATGPLNRPKLPGIPGIEEFAGHSFHTSRWDYAYTGGSYEGAPMEKLADKRVAIIGTGATAVQCIPPLGRDSKALLVFQRTPSAIDERNNHPIDPEWFSSLGEGWQSNWLRNFLLLQSGGFADEDLVMDGWTDISKRIRDRMVEAISNGAEFTPESFRQAYEDSDDEKMEEIRRRVDAIVANPEAAAGLKAWYRQLCKRPCFHDEYLQTFNRPNVHLVDTNGKGVERIDATGLWVEGVHYEVDCIVYASGFEVNTEYTRRAGFEIIGRHGRTLTEKWTDGMQSLHGMHVHGFPNLFVVGFAQASNFVSNVTSNYPDIGLTLAAILGEGERVGARVIECTAEAERNWVEQIESAPVRIIGGSECTPGYYNNEGRPMERRHKLNGSGYPLGPAAWFDHIAEWRATGDFAGLEFC
jgi:cation diffusion facilitator CzcD-associated flavoprotein CzcO